MRREASIALVVILLTAGCSASGLGIPDPGETESEATPAPMTSEVVWVEDGDTIWITNETGTRVPVRLLGIDTPETRGSNYPGEYEGVPDTAAGRNWLSRWGKRADNFTRERVGGREVRLRFDPSLPKRDLYGRLMAYVYVNNTFLNRELLERGLARSYPISHEKEDDFNEIAKRARNAERGLWNYSGG